MAVIGPNPFEIVLLLLLGGGYGMPAGLPPTAEDPLTQKIAPAECLCYVSWAGAGTPDAASGNHTEKLLAEPEVQNFLNRAPDSLLSPRRSAQADADAQAARKDYRQLLRLIQGKPGAFYISDVQLNGGAPPAVTGGGMLRMGEDGPALRKILQDLQSRLDQGQVKEVQVGNRTFDRVVPGAELPAVTWGLTGNYFVFGIGDGSLEQLLQRTNGQEPAWLTSAKARLAVPRVSSLIYLDVKQLIDKAVIAAGRPEAARTASVLGLDTIGAAVMVNGLDDTGCVMRASLSLEGAARGIFSGLDADPLVAKDLRRIASTSPAALTFKLDAAKLYDLVIDLSTQIDPDSAQAMRNGWQRMEQQIGIAIRDDLLASLGDTWRLDAQRGPDGLISGWIISVQVRDRQKLEQVQETLTTLAKTELAQAGPGAPTLQSSQIAGYTVHMVSFEQLNFQSPFAPSWCITEDELLVAVTPQHLERHLSGTGPARSLAANDDVKKFFQPGARTLALAYLDTQSVAKTLLPLAQQGYRMFSGQPGALPLSTAGLPPQEAILPHLQPSLCALQRTAEGIEFTSHQTLPGSNIGASVPVMLGLMLPEIQAARDAGRRMAGSNNLKQIGLAMHNFHDTYRALPAGYSADEEGNPLLSWRVHVLPFIEEQALFDQFHLDEPWDSPHNKRLIAQMPRIYRGPKSSAEPGMTNYLGVAGRDGVFVRPQNGNRLGAGFRDILDGTSNTIMTVEVPDESAVIWTKPGDLSPNLEKPTKGLTGVHLGGFQVGFADGSVRFLADLIDPDTLRAYFTKAGGERVNVP